MCPPEAAKTVPSPSTAGKDDGTVLTGEQKLTADLTLHGVWTFTKNPPAAAVAAAATNPPLPFRMMYRPV
ncbi:MAG: hypothetical protein ACLT2F_05205 [Butyricicoccus sp.]